MNDLSPQRTEAMLTDLAEVQTEYRPMLVRSKCAPHFKRIAFERALGGLESGGCMAGTQYGRITPEGDVTPCPYMTVVAGNIRRNSLTEIWHTAPVFVELRDLKQLKGRCGDCEFKELCGGCRCRAFAAYGDYMQEDPACTYQPTGQPLQFESITWSPEARSRLERIPIAFIREKVEKGVETYAQRSGSRVITAELMKMATAGMERPTAFQKVRSFVKIERAKEADLERLI